MIPIKTNSRFVSTEKEDTINFRVQANAKLYSLLSDKIYTCKIAAVVRELIFNAVDSHKEAGREHVPIKVKLPNILDNTFYIEDTGVGLDHDKVKEVLTVYGESTKDKTNDLVGALGLGCKSPFAYSKSFSLVAIKDGVRRTYTAYMNQEGEPQIDLISEEETDAINGVRFSLPVLEEDFRKFENECRFIFSTLKVTPEVVGIGYEFKVYFPNLYNDLSEKGYSMQIPEGFVASELYKDSFYAVMGGVCYSVATQTVIDIINEGIEEGATEEEKKKAKSVCSFIRSATMNRGYYGGRGKTIFLDFPIGSLDFIPSREYLSYDETTKANLRERTLEVIGSEIEKIQSKLDSLSLYDAVLEMKQKGFSDVLNSIEEFGFYYKGLSYSELLNKPISRGMFDGFLYRNRPGHIRGNKTALDETYLRSLYEVARSRANQTDKRVVLLYTKTGNKTKYVSEVLSSLHDQCRSVIYLRGEYTESTIKRYVKYLKGVPLQVVEWTEALENWRKVPEKTKTSLPRIKKGTMRAKVSTTPLCLFGGHFESKVVSFDDYDYFVPLNNQDRVRDFHSTMDFFVEEIKTLLSDNFGGKRFKPLLYAFCNKARYAFLGNNAYENRNIPSDKLMSQGQFLEKFLKEHQDILLYELKLNRFFLIDNKVSYYSENSPAELSLNGYGTLYSLVKKVNLEKELLTNSWFYSAQKNKNVFLYRGMHFRDMIYSKLFPECKVMQEIDDTFKGLFEQYPMLKLLSYDGKLHSEDVKMISDYMTQVDFYNSQKEEMKYAAV